jgi:hypothetical protein
MTRISGPGYPTGDENMTNKTAANGEEAAYHGVPAEDDYGYAQAIKIGNAAAVDERLLGLKPAPEEVVKDHSAL